MQFKPKYGVLDASPRIEFIENNVATVPTLPIKPSHFIVYMVRWLYIQAGQRYNQ